MITNLQSAQKLLGMQIHEYFHLLLLSVLPHCKPDIIHFLRSHVNAHLTVLRISETA